MEHKRAAPLLISKKMRYPLLAALILLLNTACREVNGNKEEPEKGASSGPTLEEALQGLVNDPALQNGRLAFLARDLASGKKEEAHRANELIVPASTQKLITTIAALRYLGPEHRFRTSLLHRGPIEDGVLKGDLIIKGGGDPAFHSEEFPEHYGPGLNSFLEMSKACRAQGIQRVEGKLLVDAGYFAHNSLAKGRIWEDMGNYFGAFPSGMNFMDNAFELHYRTPDKPEEPTSIKSMTPPIPWLDIKNRVRSSKVNEDRAYIFGKPYDTARIVEGSLPRGRDSYTIEGSMPDPARVTAWKAHQVLENNGLEIADGYSTFRLEEMKNNGKGTPIDTILSPPLSKIVHKTNFHSKNLFAECLLLEMGKALGGVRKPYPAAAVLMKKLQKEGIDTNGIRMEDGSGLAPGNRVTAKVLVDFLEKAWKGEDRSRIVNSLPVAGESGTMRYVGNGTKAEGKVRAKSGSMKGVRAYAGYAEGKDGDMKAFALIANDYTCEGAQMREKMESVLAALVGKKE